MNLLRRVRFAAAVPNYAHLDGAGAEHPNAKRSLAGHTSPMRAQNVEGIRVLSVDQPLEFIAKCILLLSRLHGFLLFFDHQGSEIMASSFAAVWRLPANRSPYYRSARGAPNSSEVGPLEAQPSRWTCVEKLGRLWRPWGSQRGNPNRRSPMKKLARSIFL